MNPEMQELVSPAQAEFYVTVATALLTVIAAVWGGYTVRWRGALAGLTGPLLWGMWQFHKWITRYDPRTGYFGLDKVKVLMFEVVVFIAIGLVLGLSWGAIVRSKRAANQ